MSYVLAGTASCPECECTFAGRWVDGWVDRFSCPACSCYFVAQWPGFTLGPETERCS